MGKVVKYCPACEESFAANFAFCPNCAAVLNDHEINPIETEAEFYQVTFVEEKGSNSRRVFLLGVALLVMSGAVFSLIGSIYSADAYIGALDDSLVYLANISNDDASKFDNLELPEDRKEGKGSGGGGGGRKDKEEVLMWSNKSGEKTLFDRMRV